VDAKGVITTIAGDGNGGSGGDGGLAVNAQLSEPFDIAVDTNGDVFIADRLANRIRKVSAKTGIISTIAGNGSSEYSGDGGPATKAGIYLPAGIALGPDGSIYVSQEGNSVIRKLEDGSIPLYLN